jgi:RNA recognition motif-containing protein
MSTRLYVGNIPLNTTDDDLAQAFGEDSRRVTSIRIIRWNNETGRRFGFAFVEMATEADVCSAIDALDGSQLNGRTLRVAEVKDRQSRRNGGRSRKGEHRPEPSRQGS